MTDTQAQTSDLPEPAAPTAEAGEKPKASGARGFWHEWVKPFLIVLLVVFSFRSAVADWNDVPTGSMRPTILEGERIFVNKLAYDLKIPFTRVRLAEWSDPQRGDVVVLYSPKGERKRLVKRVIGVPGDEVSMVRGRLRINGEVASYQRFAPEDHEGALGLEVGALVADGRVLWESMEDLDRHPVIWRQAPGSPQQRNFGPNIIPEGQYWVMGDNRDNSSDSRSFGVVDRNLIVGEATAVVFSLDPERSRRPRWSRFFLGLP
ncbi:MAG: signal peptidase I [Acidobacteriota bacterium]